MMFSCKNIFVPLFSFFIILGSQSFAFSTKDIISNPSPEVRNILLKSTGDALITANASLAVKNQDRLFCPPEDLKFSPVIYEEILKVTVEQYLELNDLTLASSLLFGLTMFYPCK